MELPLADICRDSFGEQSFFHSAAIVGGQYQLHHFLGLFQIELLEEHAGHRMTEYNRQLDSKHYWTLEIW